MKIPFNKPYTTGKELQYISEAIASGQISGNGPFTKKCHELLVSSYGFSKPLLTSSCTDALEMSAIPLSPQHWHLKDRARKLFLRIAGMTIHV
jgi:dTDP-4-amino-4,6-dideoxygalactose transaminase